MTGNAKRGEVTLELGGESYVLVPCIEAIIEIENEMDTNLFEIGRRLESAEISASELIDFTQACTTQAGYQVTREHLGEAIVEAGAQQAITALTEYCRNYVFGVQHAEEDGAAETESPTKAGDDGCPDLAVVAGARADPPKDSQPAFAIYTGL